MKPTICALAIMAFTTLVSCSSPTLPATTPPSEAIVLRLSSTSTTTLLLEDLTAAYQEVVPTIRFESVSGNHLRLIDRLETGETPYILTSHLPVDSGLWAAPIAQDGIVILLHPTNTITDLSLEQIRLIYQGQINNWRDLGGEDATITVLSREEGSAIRAEFERLVMGQRRTTSNAQIVPSQTAMQIRLDEAASAIGYIALSSLPTNRESIAINGIIPTPTTVADYTYPLRSTLYIVGKAEPETDYRIFVGWIQSIRGQQIVRKHYTPLP